MYNTKCVNEKSVQIHAAQSYQKEVNDKYLESSDIQHTGPGRVTSISCV